MTTTPTITNREEEYAALDRLAAVRYRTDFTDEELVEYRALSKALSDYQHETIFSKLPKGDAAAHFEMGLDVGLYELDELLPIFGGMDAFIAFMTREMQLSAELIDELVAELSIDRDDIDGPFIQPGGWDMMEWCDDGEDWRAEMIAHRDAKAGTNTDIQDMQDQDANVSGNGAVSPGGQKEGQLDPELAATA